MAAEFKILVGADLDAAVKSINDFVKTTKNGFGNIDAAVLGSINEFKKLQSLLNKSEDPKAIAIYQKQLQSLAATLSSQIPPAAAKSAAALNNVNKAVANANPTLVNFGRVVQDAPFGIIGIANNIDPLISSFQSLKASTGSTGAALKSLFSALAGPAGIAIGVSAVTSALIAFGPQIKNFFAGTSALTEEQKKFNEELQSAKASAISVGVQLQALTKIAGDASQSDKVRTEALRQVNKETEKYGVTITQAGIASGEASKFIDKLTESLVQQAVAAKFADKVAELKVKEIELTKELANITKEEALAKEALGRLNRDNASEALIAQQVELSAIKDARRKISANKELATAQRVLTDAQDLFNTSLKASLELTKVPPPPPPTRDAIKAIKDFGSAAESAGFDLNELFASIGTFTTGQEKAVRVTTSETSALLALAKAADAAFLAKQKTVALDKQKALGGDLPTISATGRGPAKAALEASDAFFKRGDENLKNFDAKVALASENLTGLFTGAFQALSQGESPIQAITQSLKQLIVRLAAAAATAAVLSLILGGITGGAPVIAGAASNSFGGIFKSLLGLASGGIASRPTPALIGDGGAEAVIPLSQLANIIGGVAMQMGGGSGGNLSIVRGQDIYYSNNNASRSFGRLFG